MIGLEVALAAIVAAIGAVWFAFRRGTKKGAAEVRADQAAGSVAAERQRKEIRNDIAEDEDLATRARRGGLVRPERR